MSNGKLGVTLASDQELVGMNAHCTTAWWKGDIWIFMRWTSNVPEYSAHVEPAVPGLGEISDCRMAPSVWSLVPDS